MSLSRFCGGLLTDTRQPESFEYVGAVGRVEIDGDMREFEEFMAGTAMDRRVGAVSFQEDENTG